MTPLVATPITDPVGVELGAVYIITGPDGTRAVLNDPDDPDFVGYTTGDDGVTGLERAGVRESADVLPEADGGVHGAFRYDRLAFTLKGIILPELGASPLQQAKLLRATDAMLADATLEWAPSSAPPVRVNFRQQQPTRITGRRPKGFMVAGVSEDPLIYSQQLHAEEISPTAASGGGFSSPLTSPLASTAGIAGQILATNLGIRPTWPLFTITGPATNPSITNVTTGKTLSLIYTLGVGEYLEVDTNPRRRTIRLNGTGNRYDALDFAGSEWFPLEPGENDLRVGLDAGGGGGSLFAVDWRDAWG